MDKKNKDGQFFNFFGGTNEKEYGDKEAKNEESKGLFSLFSTSNKGNNKADVEAFTSNQNTPLMNSLKTGFMNKALGMKETIAGTVDSGANYKYFTIFMAVGVALLFLSLLFLPVVVLSPHKFA